MRREWFRRWCVLAMVAGCGDNSPGRADFQIVGHHDLGARGMNAALAVAGDTVYVGSRIDTGTTIALDVSNPRAPVQIGELPAAQAMSSRELRAVADRNLLVILSLRCSPDLHGCQRNGGIPEAIELYDITDRAAPVQKSRFPIQGSFFNARGPHELYLRRDGDRVLLFIASPPVVLDILDVTDPSVPALIKTWNPMVAAQGEDDILHSVSMSLDGERLFLSHQQGGLYIADATGLPELSVMSSPLDFTPPGASGPHSAVEVPGRDLVIVTEEVYPPPYGAGCPWGGMRLVDVSDPTTPVELSEFHLPEQDPALCATQSFERITFTAHNTTATAGLALITWHAAGLQAIDISNPRAPFVLGEFRPEPLAAVTTEDPGLGGAPIEMWSTPVIKDGLIYVVDVRNGLYILRYRGPYEDQLAADPFIEGNSNL
jgi:hypothetical protein